MKKTIYSLALISSLFIVTAASAQTTYTITDLGTLGGSSSTAEGINSLGQVVGYSVRADGLPCAFIYSNGTMLNLGTTGGSLACSTGAAINNAGQATGSFPKPWLYPQYPVWEAFLYSGGMTDIGTLSTVGMCCGTPMSQGTAINNLGQVAGNSYLNDQSTMGFLYSNGAMTPIGSLYTGPNPYPGSFFDWSAAAGINDSGQIVGYSAAASNPNQWDAFLWSNGKMQDLGTLGGPGSAATAINNAGQVTGYAYMASGKYHAFLYTGGVMEDIGTLGGSASTGYAINNLGQILGGAATNGNAAMHPFLYTPGKTPGTGTMVDLQTLLPSGSKYVLSAYGNMGINDAGQIAINGTNPQGANHALLLTPLNAEIALKATQYGSGGTTIQLQWNYGEILTSRFYIHRQPPSGGVYVIPVDADPAHCSGSLPVSVCTYDDSAITAYGTYSYTVQAGDYDPPSNTSTAYQLNTYIGSKDPSTILSLFTPDPNLSVSAVAQAMGYDHFNWIQVITYEPACNPLHVYDPAFAVPTKGAAVVAPHLDPPLGGYTEFKFYEMDCGGTPCAGPSDNLPYYFDENPNTGDPLYWFMYPTATPKHQINPGGTLDSNMANGLQTAHIMTRFYDQPQEACIKGADYMGFVNTLVGVKTGVGQLPSTSDALTTYVWNSNYNGTTGGVKRDSLPPWETPYDPNATGGIFNVAPVDVNSLPLNVRQLLVDNGVQGVTTLPGGAPIAPMTAAFLSGTLGTNGWYTSPVLVTLIATDPVGPQDIASTSYNLDNTGAEIYSDPFIISTDGAHTIVYGSTNQASVAESPQPSSTVKIDQTPPASHVSALPASESSANFILQWSGADAGSGIQDYSIFVSDNGGAFTPWQTNNPATSATFSGQAGHTYGFYSLARDLAGNVEPAKSEAEATTTAAAGGAATPTVTVLPSPSPATTTQSVTVNIKVSGGSGSTAPTGSVTLTSGTTISASATLNGGSATINIAASSLAIGSNLLSVAYTPDTSSSSAYTAASGTASVTIEGYPVITWPTPAAITYGTSLGAAQLDATASVSGAFTYQPLAGSVLDAGSQTLGVRFNPSDTTDYLTVTASVVLQVNQASQAITFSALPATATFGAAGPYALSATGGASGNPVVFGVTGAGSLNGSQLTITGAGLVTVSANQAGNTDYSAAPQVTESITVSKALPSAALTSNLNPALLQNTITLTARVTSAAGTPTGTVTFLDGSTPLGTGTLAGGVATYTTSSLAVGSHSITVAYSGDSNFLAVSSSPSLTQLVQDFGFSISSSSVTALPGGQAVFSFTVSPTGGSTFPSAIALTVSGLPTGATYTFAPASLAAGASATPVTLTIVLPQTLASITTARRLAPFSLALLLLPFAFRLRRTGKRLRNTICVLAMLTAGLAAVAGISSCGSGTGYFAQQQKTYTVTVTGSAGTLSHSANLTLTVE